ncbi:MAG: helix-turn-helix transcriptional regulator [Mesorhizobium sp.]|uniref:helix-turn-helix domain-containing protein n=1 Tax=Mesorhizobium sp. TaxID=1871066 RepID=UPI00121781FD|nr:helix-turn-helix transcriptional regulator [Mesorhizobium sp.]TIR28284.1 MAG: helix-turn-helix transcriptional regulator [Mesorhizobium sp.]TIS21339.1 MAG: helix-turn-helix transcriptional regulator [Mesorhizobium sp.]
MTTLPTIENTKEPPERISRGDLASACIRNQYQAHDLLLRVIDEAGVSQKKLANLSGIDEATVSRLLNRPRNMEIDTLSKLVFAARGATLTFSVAFPSQGHTSIVLCMDDSSAVRKSTATRRFVYALSESDTAAVPFSASTNQDLFATVAASATSSGRIREVTDA